MADQIKRLLPFKLISSSLNSGYLTYVSGNGLPGLEFVNIHRDLYGDLDSEALQGTFTKRHVGGEQHRHVSLNLGEDNDYTRPELYKIQITSSQLRIYGPEYEDTNKPRARLWRGAASPVNISNIKNYGNTLGNFNKNYEVFQTSGRILNNNLIADGYTSSVSITPTQFIFGANNFTLPSLLTSSKSVIVERFNAPGDKKQSSRGSFERAGEEMSPNNSLTTRNIVVRQKFYNQLSQHSPQFGSGSTSAIPPETGMLDTVSIHKVNRNGLRKIKLSGSSYVSSSNYDNYWVQHAIPQDNFGYAWITASAVSNPYTIGASSIQFDITSSLSTIKDKQINLDTQTINGSIKNVDGYYSTLRQVRTGEHPVARKLRQNNLLSIEDTPTHNQNIISIRSGKSTNFKEPPITNKYYPIKQKIRFEGEPEGEYTSLIYSYKNIASKFANESINLRLNLNENKVSFYQKIVDSKDIENSPILDISELKFKENVFPRAQNTYLSGTRSRTSYILDQAGFDRDGYDRQLGTQRVFWRDNQEDRRRSANSIGGHINSLGYSSLEESGSNFTQNESSLLFSNEFILMTSSYIQNSSNLDKGINNSIIPLETSSSDRQLYVYSGSYLIEGSYEGDLLYKIASNISKNAIIQDVAGEFNFSFSDFYEQFVKNNKKQSIGAIYRNTDFKKYLTALSTNRDNLLDKVSRIDDEEFTTNPRPKYVSFIGGGELNTGSIFDNSTNFSNLIENIYYSGFNGGVNNIFINEKYIIFAGRFSGIYKGLPFNNIIAYNLYEKNFETFNRGVSSAGVLSPAVNSVVVSGTDIYVGGAFTFAGDSSANRIARWSTTGSTWSALGSGVNSNVTSVVVSGTDIYVGGNFTTAGGSSANRIARWSTTGSVWSALGSGVNSSVNSVALSGTDIYVGGAFTTASGTPANRIARWSTTGSVWSALGSGIDDPDTNSEFLRTIAVSGTDIYVGGNFTTAGGSSANRIARWSTTGSTWSALGNGIDDSDTTTQIYSIVVSGTDIYAAGRFTTASGTPANRIARWSTTGSVWSSLGSQLNSTVLSLAVSGAYIYIGGNFTSNASSIGSRITLYDIKNNIWEKVNYNKEYSNFNYNLLLENLNYNSIHFSTLDNGLIKQNDVLKNRFYDNISEYSKNDIYRISKNYSIVPEFKISEHLEYYVNNNNNFKEKNNSFLILDGAGEIYKSSTTEISNLDNKFFEQYSFTDILNKNNIEIDYSSQLKQDNISINVKGIKKLLPYNGFYPQDRTIQLANLYNDYVDNVLSGGIYNLENINLFNKQEIISGTNNIASSVANLSLENFQQKNILLKQLRSNLNGRVYSVQILGTDIYVGGSFTKAGGLDVNYIARYSVNDNSWSSLGNGVDASVYSMVISGTDIYVGGAFLTASGTPANRIARWSTTGSVWSALGSGVSNVPSLAYVNSVEVSGTDIYVGGYFSTASGTPALNIARWSTTGSVWSSLGIGFDSYLASVNSVAVSGTDIYVGGDFTTVDGSSANRIARWSTTGSVWSSLGSGVNDGIQAIKVSGTDIYVGGFFSTAGGTPAVNIARWSTTGSVWSSLGSGVGNSVYSLAISGTDIYVGGDFSTAGGSSAVNIARWSTTGSAWSSLGSQLNSTVLSLAVSGAYIYIGGNFTTNKNSNEINYFGLTNTDNYSIESAINDTTYLYSSSNNTYKNFDNNFVKKFDENYLNSKLVSSSNGLNIFSFKNKKSDFGNRKFINLNTNSSLTEWSSEIEILSSSHAGDQFGEYWDYINISQENKIIFAVSSPQEQADSKTSAGVVRIITSSLHVDSLGQTNFVSSSVVIVGTGSNSNNQFGTGISLISCSSGYQLFIGETFGDTTSTNFGNIWVSTSSNGEIWSTPISIISGSNISSSIGYNNIKAVNFTKNNISRTYLFFTEPFSKPITENDYLLGKLFVISSSNDNYWGSTNINSEKTELYNIGISPTISGTLFDVTGSNKYSIEVHSDNNKITYCFVNSIEDSQEEFSEIRIGNSYDGINWQKQDQMFKQQNININGCEVVGKLIYNFNDDIQFPVFFTNISNSSGIDAIYAFENNKFTQFKLNTSGTEKYVKQAALEPVMAPGILYNTIKSGIAVDWPCATGSQTSIEPYGSGTIVNAYYPQSFKMAKHNGENIDELNIYGSLRSNIDYRVDFEKLIFPDDIFPVKQELTSSLSELTTLTSLSQNSELVQFISGCYIYGGYEPYTSPVDFSDYNQLGPKRFSVPFVYRKENAKDNGLYSMAMSNFLAETVKFFLRSGLLTSFQSKPDSEWGVFESGKKYYMDIIMSKSPRLVMMEAYHSDKHPTGSRGQKMNGRYFGYPVNKTNKKLWSADSDELFTEEEARLIHNDPAYAPYTPPYFEGSAIARVSFSPATTKNYKIDEIFSQLVVENIFPGVQRGAHTGSDAYLNKMPIESSMEIKGKLPWVDRTTGDQNSTTTNYDVNTWIISTKFETPVLNFSSQSLTPYSNNYLKSSGYGRGMWSGYGQIPGSNENIFISLLESFPQQIRGTNSSIQSLLQKVGFTQTSKKVGLIADQKVIKEAVMIIPFIENTNTTGFRKYSYSETSKLTDIEKELNIEFIGVKKDIYNNILTTNVNNSIKDTIKKMREFIVPPQLDYVKDTTIDPYVAYIASFEHKLTQQDLADIWQGVAPRIATTAEFDTKLISHKNSETEFFHGQGIPNDVRFMVFKIKQKGESDYFKVTRDSTDDSTFERQIGRKIDDYSYNWPYDFYSLVELAKIDVDITYKKKKD